MHTVNVLKDINRQSYHALYVCVWRGAVWGRGDISRGQKSHSKRVNYIQSLSFSSLSSNYPVTLKMGHVH